MDWRARRTLIGKGGAFINCCNGTKKIRSISVGWAISSTWAGIKPTIGLTDNPLQCWIGKSPKSLTSNGLRAVSLMCLTQGHHNIAGITWITLATWKWNLSRMLWQLHGTAGQQDFRLDFLSYCNQDCGICLLDSFGKNAIVVVKAVLTTAVPYHSSLRYFPDKSS